MITSIPYIKVVRTIENNVQYNTETIHTLSLSEEKIQSSTHEFLIKNVLDISYRSISADSGFLYLHTNQGVFSYHIKTMPNDFIEEFKKLK